MTALPHNIDKSAFHRGDSPISDVVTRNTTIFAWTLDDMGAKLVNASKEWDGRRKAREVA